MTNKRFHFGNLEGLPFRDGGTIPGENVRKVVLEVMAEIEAICDVTFVEAQNQGAKISVNNFTNTHRGAFTSGGNIYVNSAIGTPKWPNKKWVSEFQVLKLMRHEIGHFLGMEHSKHPRDVMHSNASAFQWHTREVVWLVRRFGPPFDPNDPKTELEKADRDLRDDMKIAAKVLGKRYKTYDAQLEAIDIFREWAEATLEAAAGYFDDDDDE